MKRVYFYSIKFILLGIALIGSSIALPDEADINICTDQNYWYPYSFAENQVSKGLHIDVVQKACDALQVTCSFRPYPWKRCLAYAKNGRFDAVVSTSYKPDRALFLWYPPGVEKQVVSPSRITQAEYVVVTYANNPYEYDGVLKNIPQPLRIPLGYSIGDDFKQEGINVSINLTSLQNFKELSRSTYGSVVTIKPNAEKIIKMLKLDGVLKIHDIPIKSKSYFIAFSKKTKISEKQRNALWQSVIKIRENSVEFEKLLMPY